MFCFLLRSGFMLICLRLRVQLFVYLTFNEIGKQINRRKDETNNKFIGFVLFSVCLFVCLFVYLFRIYLFVCSGPRQAVLIQCGVFWHYSQNSRHFAKNKHRCLFRSLLQSGPLSSAYVSTELSRVGDVVDKDDRYLATGRSCFVYVGVSPMAPPRGQYQN